MTLPPLLDYQRPQYSSRLAIASLICGCVAAPGVVAFCMCFACYAPIAGASAIAAIVCGTLALRAIATSGGQMRGRPPAIIGLVLGSIILLEYLALGVLVLVSSIRGPTPSTFYVPSTAPTSASRPATLPAPELPAESSPALFGRP